MTWLATLPIIFASAALLFIPGLAFSAAIGLRGLSAWAGAPVFTVAFSSIAAIVCGALGIPWTVIPVLVLASVASCVVWLVRRHSGRDGGSIRGLWKPQLNRSSLIPIFGFAAGAAITARQLTRVFGAPSNISQTFDNIFHLNAIRFVLETGNASSMTIATINIGDAPPTFYPAAWHGLVALLIQITGTPLSVAVNALNITIAALVWTLGCMLLTRVIIGPNLWAVAFAGVLAASFSSFPVLLLHFGVLYPNFLAIAMLPFALAAVAGFFGVAASMDWSRSARFLMAPTALIALAIAHPNGLMTLVALSIPVALVAYWRYYVRTQRWRTHKLHTSAASLGVVVGVAALVKIWDVIRPPAEASTWEPRNLPAGALGEIMTNSAMGRPAAWLLSALMLVGIYAAIRSGGFGWLLGCFAVTTFLFLVVSSAPQGYFRSAVTGVWYNDSYRLAAILPITALPLAALGFVWLLEFVHNKAKQSPITSRPGKLSDIRSNVVFRTAAGLVIIVLLAVGMQGNSMKHANRMASESYMETPDAALLSPDELALINELDEIVGPNEVIAASPWTGAALAFALGDRWTTSMHTLSTYSRNIQIINEHLRDAYTNPEVCPAVKATGVRFALDFGSREVHGGTHIFTGLDSLGTSPAFELVAQVGEAKLFKLIAC